MVHRCRVLEGALKVADLNFQVTQTQRAATCPRSPGQLQAGLRVSLGGTVLLQPVAERAPPRDLVPSRGADQSLPGPPWALGLRMLGGSCVECLSHRHVTVTALEAWWSGMDQTVPNAMTGVLSLHGQGHRGRRGRLVGLNPPNGAG